jgi:hypothetical protein
MIHRCLAQYPDPISSVRQLNTSVDVALRSGEDRRCATRETVESRKLAEGKEGFGTPKARGRNAKVMNKRGRLR